jgi:hypothetical protein
MLDTLRRLWTAGLSRKVRRAGRSALHWRPRLEVLEDRLVPSITVNTTQDPMTATPGVLSLRQAIALVNAGQVADNTVILPSGNYVNAQGALEVTHSLVLQGAGAGSTAIDGAGVDRVVFIDPKSAVSVQLSGVTVRDGALASSGAGIDLFDAPGQSSALTLTDCIVSGNRIFLSGLGAGIDANQGSITLIRCQVVDNMSDGYGGGVATEGGGAGNTLVVQDSTIRDNRAGLGGGGIAAFGSLTVAGSTISGNQAGFGGGGIAAFGGLTITDSVIRDNTLTGSARGGGGVYLDTLAAVLIGNSTISGNLSLQDGGGLDNVNNAPATFTLTGDTIDGNRAAGGNGGGLALTTAANLTVQDSTISNNFASVSGGGLDDSGAGKVTLANCTVSGNQSGGGTGGGGVDYTGAGSVQISNSVFRNNLAKNALTTGGGGGLEVQNAAATATITDSLFQSNTADAAGGGVDVFSGLTLTVTASTFVDNQTLVNFGGGLNLVTTGTNAAGTASTLTNDTIVGNSSTLVGGGVEVFGSDFDFINDTITGNRSIGVNVNQGTGFFLNTIVAGNIPSAGLSRGADVSVSIFGNVTSRGGNFIGDDTGLGGVLFPAGSPNANGDFAGTNTVPLRPMLGPLQPNGGPSAGAPGDRQVIPTEALLAGSPAINAGVLTGAPLTDQRGVPRTDGKPDIGAFEVDTTPPTVTLGQVPALDTAPVDTITVTFSKPVTGLTLASFQLLSGGVNVLTDAQTLTTADNITWTLGNLKGLTDPTHRVAAFTLTLSSAGVTDIAGNALAQGASVSFTEIDPNLSLQGRTLTFMGTPGNDTFTFTPGTPEVVSLDGVRYIVDPAVVDRVQFVGNGGTDTAVLMAGGTGNTATLSPGAGQLSGKGYSVSVSGVTDLFVYGGTTDTATLSDTLGGASFLGTPGYSYLKVGSLVSEVIGFHFALATARPSSSDTAYFYDSAGDDVFVGTPSYSYMATGGVAYAQANGFQTAVAFSLFGGKDKALLYDSGGNDIFVAAPSYAYLASGGVVYAQADGFAQVQAFSTGGSDAAYFYDSVGHDTFVGTPSYSYLAGTGLLEQANGFKVVNAYALAGGDTALLFDSPGDDTFVGQGNTAALSGPGYAINLSGFADVVASSSAGGHDHKQVGVIDYLFSAPGNWR